MNRFLFVCLLVFFSVSVSSAAIPNKEKYDPYFKVDLKEELPTYEFLQKNYFDKHANYDRHYQWHWAIGNLFDSVFRETITLYGGTERRVKAEHEDSLMMSLRLIPPEYYQYIGPYLHTIPGISEKILNMPGIKETKNKFPTRVAKRLQDIEDLEFLSPYLYFLLMPEVWGEDTVPHEEPQQLKKKKPVASMRNTKLYEMIKNLVPAEEFYPDAVAKTGVDASDLRTIEVTETSPLTSGDIKAFVRTLPELNKIQSDLFAMGRIYGAGTLLDVWENENGRGLPVNSFKDLIYPCSRLVQKMRIAGEERYLQSVVSKEGFTPEEWAYTCDKTIRAYRMATISQATATSLKAFALGAYEDDLRSTLDEDMLEIQHLNYQAALRMHEVSRHDVLEAYKNRLLLRDSFKKAGYTIIAAPIAP